MAEIPDGAKLPQDHAAKAEAKIEPIAFEHNGTTYSINPDVVNDVELMEDLADLEESPYLMPRVTRRILGAEQWATFKSANRDPETNVVRAEALSDLFEILNDSLGK